MRHLLRRVRRLLWLSNEDLGTYLAEEMLEALDDIEKHRRK